MLRYVPNAFFELTITAFYKIEKLLSSYLLGILMQMGAIFLLALFGYWLIGMQYAVTVALFAAVINILPYVGPLLSNLTAIVVGLSTTPGVTEDQYFSYGIQIMSVGLVIHLIDNIALEPVIFSRNLKAHPLEIFVAIFAGSSLGGVAGMVLALPVYTVLRVTVSEISDGYRAYRVFKARSKLSALVGK
jgi:predicted PurR-regulated permease PerM